MLFYTQHISLTSSQCANQGDFFMINSFPKKHLNYLEQIHLLESRNLSVPNYDFAIKKLKNINYYRLTPYFYNFFERRD
jgi:hypothetical protein